jgi:toxin-antitoxin system PIN domain toxin
VGTRDGPERASRSVIGLLDVGVLVALFDPAHIHHDLAHAWLDEHRAGGWATCPVSENGFAAAVAHPDYPGRRCTVAQALELLQAFTESGDHHFWPDSTSIRRASRFDASKLDGHARITTAYLLLLAVHHGGRLVTFDAGLPIEAVRPAEETQLVVLAPGTGRLAAR